MPPDRRIARHLRNQIDVEGEQRGLQPHARRRHRGLASGMTGAHHHHIEMFIKRLHAQLAIACNAPGGKL